VSIQIGLVAGEASGDILGHALIDAIRRLAPDATFVGIGGPKMIGAGMESWFDQERLAVRGLVEVLKHIPQIARIRRGLYRRFVQARPALVLGIDAPDFNLGLERRLRKAGIKTMHCVSPTIWAWRPGRIRGIRRAVDHMLVLFPFEERLYREAGIPVTFIGHPLADQISATIDRDAIREQLQLKADATVVAMLPGSRQSEIKLLAPTFIECVRRMVASRPGIRFLVPFVTGETRQLFEEVVYAMDARSLPITLLYGHSHDAMAAADVVLAASGTATLEGALIGRPMVIAYRLKPVSYWLAKRMVRTPHVGLPNILAGEALCPEFLQDDATGENLAQATLNLLSDAGLRASLETRLGTLRAQLAQGAAERGAQAILANLSTTHGPSR
jgi:lipid-A-disaccharide synthase